MAPAAPTATVEHTSAKAGRSPQANKSRRCQDLGNIVHLEHVNLEASIHLITSLQTTTDAFCVHALFTNC